jgi:spoIIIJ-associated protein
VSTTVTVATATEPSVPIGPDSDPIPEAAVGSTDPPANLDAVPAGHTPAGPTPAGPADDAGHAEAVAGDAGHEAGQEEGGDDEPAAEASAVRDEELLVREGDVAGDYLERLLDIADYDGDIDLDVEGDRAVVAIVGGDLQQLVGPSGSTLEALQELTRLAVQQRTGVRSRLMLDIDGYRSRRRDELAELARATAAKVLAAGDPVRLVPMNPFERKVVHDVITQLDGVYSESEGEEPQRCVVVSPDR